MAIHWRRPARTISTLGLCACIYATCAPSTLSAQDQWVQLGPGPTTGGQVANIVRGEVVGAINAVALNLSDANNIYIGAVNGGIWKTSDATAAAPHWSEQLGLDRPLSISAIKFDPLDRGHQTLIAGSGRFSSFGGVGGEQAGLWRTTNGGNSWTQLNGNGLLRGLNVSGVAARGPMLVFSVNAADAVSNVGVWRSDDAGTTWTRVSGAVGTGLPPGAAYDLAEDPSDNSTLFSSAGQSGVFRSQDFGVHWTKVSDATMDAFVSISDRVRISVGTSHNVYAAIVIEGQLAALFRSGDGGTHWAALDLPVTHEAGGVAVGIHPGKQGSTHLSIVADRGNPDVVYIGGDRQPYSTEFTTGGDPWWPNSLGANDFTGRLFRVDASRPSGQQARSITDVNTSAKSAPHADSRDLGISASGDLIEVDDGGIYRRTLPNSDSGDWFSLNGDIKVTELHSVAWDGRSKLAIAGAQDTGTPQEGVQSSQTWVSIATGDGGDVAVDDKTTPGRSVRFSSSLYLSDFHRQIYDDQNNLLSEDYPALSVVAGGANFAGQFYTPIRLNSIAPTRLIIGGANSVYESDDQGDSMHEIAPGVVANAEGGNPIAYGAVGNVSILYIGAGDRVFVRTAARPAAVLASTTYPGMNTGRTVVGVALATDNGNIAYAIDETHVYRTSNAGKTWSDVTGNLSTLSPGGFLSVVVVGTGGFARVVVGTYNSVYSAPLVGSSSWTALGMGLPRVPVYHLAYGAADNVLIAATLGRGSWVLTTPSRPPSSKRP